MAAKALRALRLPPAARPCRRLPGAAWAAPRRRPWPWPRPGTAAQRRGLCAFGGGNELLRHIAEHGAQPFSRCSLEELLTLQELSPAERHQHLAAVLHVGISKIIMLLQDLPLGFGSTPTIRKVIQDYVQDLRDLRGAPPGDAERFERCILAIFSRHRGMMKQIAGGLLDFQAGLRRGFEPFAEFTPTSCVEASETVPAIRHIEAVLDEFFTVRTTLRLLIAHCVQLEPEAGRQGAPASDLLLRVPEGLRSAAAAAGTRHVGAICLDTRPSLILIEAFQHAHYMCQREFRRAPPLLVNGVPAREYLLAGAGLQQLENQFPYVDIHLYFVFFEVIKNALLTSIRKAGPDGTPEPIHASLITGTSLSSENERTVKITDSGEGIHREDVRKVFSYFYSAGAERGPPSAGPAPPLPLSRPGLGLAVSRVLVRYFGGEIDLHSIPRKGTDVYIYL